MTAPPSPLGTRLVRVSDEFAGTTAWRTLDGHRVAVEWGEPDAFGVYVPSLTVDRTDSLPEGLRREFDACRSQRDHYLAGCTCADQPWCVPHGWDRACPGSDGPDMRACERHGHVAAAEEEA